MGFTSSPTDCAADWITPNMAVPEGMSGSRRTATRVTLGATCLRRSSHFPLKLYSNTKKPVALPPGLARLSTMPPPTGSTTPTNTIGKVRLLRCNGATLKVPLARMTSGPSASNSVAYLRARSTSSSPQRVSIRMLPPSVQPNCCSFCLNAASRALTISIVRGPVREHTDPPHLLGLLRARGERPRHRPATEQSDELPPPHSITSSARLSSESGTVRPRALAVLRLRTNSTLVDCCTGRLAGLSPLRTRPT